MAFAMSPEVDGIDLATDKPIHFSVKDVKKATVLIFISAKCPCSASHEPVLRELALRFKKPEFQFVGIHSNPQEEKSLYREHFLKAALGFPVIHDPQTKLADLLGARVTPHVFVVSPDLKVLFQGGVDESHNAAIAKKHYLENALTQLSRGEEVTQKEARTIGCSIR
jgi:hypothetical protein